MPLSDAQNPVTTWSKKAGIAGICLQHSVNSLEQLTPNICPRKQCVCLRILWLRLNSCAPPQLRMANLVRNLTSKYHQKKTVYLESKLKSQLPNLEAFFVR